MIPFSKNTKLKNGDLMITEMALQGESEACNFAKKYLHYFIPSERIVAKVQKANVSLIYAEELSQGGYSLLIEDGCEIRYCDMEGVRNALATLIQLIEWKDGAYCLQRQRIEDYPDCAHRGVMIDLARGLPKIERLKEDLRNLSLAKCNQVHFHLMDGEGICYQSNVFPFEGEINGTKPYTQAAMRALVSYCNELGMEIIPEIEFPAHADSLTEKYPYFKCQTDIENQNGWTLCLGNEEVYLFFEKLMAEVCDIFPSKYIHIGGDEHAFEDVPSLNRLYYWKECAVCKEKMKQEGFTSERELFYYAVRRFVEMAKQHGRKIIVWNDELDVSKTVDIPKDCIVQFWRIANEHRGPRAGCSYVKLLEQGFKVICSPFEYCYIDLEEYANPEKTASFDYKAYEGSELLSKNVIGAEVCAWEYGNPEYNHYTYSFAPSAILLLAKMWNRQDVVYNKSYRKQVTKLILGVDCPREYDLFELFGSIMPPRINAVNSYVSIQNELIDKATLEKHRKALSNISFTHSPNYRREMVTLIDKMLQQK